MQKTFHVKMNVPVGIDPKAIIYCLEQAVIKMMNNVNMDPEVEVTVGPTREKIKGR